MPKTNAAKLTAQMKKVDIVFIVKKCTGEAIDQPLGKCMYKDLNKLSASTTMLLKSGFKRGKK